MSQPENRRRFVPRFDSRKPVFILVGKETFSAAENLAYSLQALETAQALAAKAIAAAKK